MEILDVLDIPGYYCMANLVTSQATHPNHIWTVCTESGQVPHLSGINVSDPSNLFEDKVIPGGEDPTSSAPNKFLYADRWVNNVEDSYMVVSGLTGLSKFNMVTESFHLGRRLVHPDELSTRAVSSSTINGNTLAIASGQLDTVTLIDVTGWNGVELSRYKSFSTWADAGTYGITEMTVDTSGPNYLDGVMGIVSNIGLGSNTVLAVSPQGWVSHVEFWPLPPKKIGTPINIGGGGGLNFAFPFKGKYVLICGGQYLGGSTPPSIYLVDISGASPVLVSTFTEPSVTGMYSSIALVGSSIVLATLVDNPSGLVAIDYSDVTNPQTIEVLLDDRFTNNGPASYFNWCQMLVRNREAYVRTGYISTDPGTYGEEFFRLLSIDISGFWEGGGGGLSIPSSWAIGLDMTRAVTVEEASGLPDPILSWNSRDWTGGTIVTGADPVGTNRTVGYLPNTGTAGSFYNLPVNIRHFSLNRFLLECRMESRMSGASAWFERIFPVENEFWDDMGGPPESAPFTIIVVCGAGLAPGTTVESKHVSVEFVSNVYTPTYLFGTYLGAYHIGMSARFYPGLGGTQQMELLARDWLEENYNLEYDPIIFEQISVELQGIWSTKSDILGYNYYTVSIGNLFDSASVTRNYGIPYNSVATNAISDTFSLLGPGGFDAWAYHDRHTGQYHRFGWMDYVDYRGSPPVRGEPWYGVSGIAVYRSVLNASEARIAAQRLGVSV